MTPRAAPAIKGFTFVEHIGSGGFADVHLYEQRLPARKVAIKVLHEQAADGAVLEQFHAEANVMAQLSGHPSIVVVHAADVSDDGRPYLVMEYCPPPSLAGRYRAERISLAEALETGIRIASAVETVHRAGLLHRDIKPHNILTDSRGAAKLTDFGIAGAASDDGETTYGMSVPWSPPESFRDVPPADRRVDVYALAATVYSLLAGRSPFEVPGGANDNHTLMNRIERQALAPLTRSDVPASLNQILTRAMSKAIVDRHESALALAHALQGVQVELGLAQTWVDVHDASQAAKAETHDEQRTYIRPVTIIVPDALVQSGTLLRPRVVPPAPDATIGRATPSVDATVLGAARGLPAPARVPEATGEESTAVTPRRSWGKGQMAAVAALAILLPVGAALALGGGDDDKEADRDAFEASDAPADAVVDFVPQLVGLRATSTAGKVTFSWRNPEPEQGDQYGVQWQVDNQAEAPVTTTKERFVGRADADQIVCVEILLVRASGQASVPVESCEQAG